jgi:hypothetical protein
LPSGSSSGSFSCPVWTTKCVLLLPIKLAGAAEAPIMGAQSPTRLGRLTWRVGDRTSLATRRPTSLPSRVVVGRPGGCVASHSFCGWYGSHGGCVVICMTRVGCQHSSAGCRPPSRSYGVATTWWVALRRWRCCLLLVSTYTTCTTAARVRGPQWTPLAGVRDGFCPPLSPCRRAMCGATLAAAFLRHRF